MWEIWVLGLVLLLFVWVILEFEFFFLWKGLVIFVYFFFGGFGDIIDVGVVVWIIECWEISV